MKKYSPSGRFLKRPFRTHTLAELLVFAKTGDADVLDELAIRSSKAADAKSKKAIDACYVECRQAAHTARHMQSVSAIELRALAQET